MKKYQFGKSLSLFRESCDYLAGGVSSQFRALGKPHPLFFSHAKGSRIYDVDGNEYIDFTLSQGPLILGHCHPELVRKVSEELQCGQLYGGQFEKELQLARRLTEILPGVERIRFCTSGSEAVQVAIRLARAVTGKKKILKFEGHYHGWLDNVLVSVQPPLEEAGPEDSPRSVPSTLGQPGSVVDEVTVLSWNDLQAVQRKLEEDGDIAAVITEPVMCNTSCILPRPGYLEGMRELCDRFGVLLIFDEIITGFRLSLGGAQEYLGITADLATYGKALAAGFPISAIAGKKKYMDYLADGRVMHAGTLNSNNASVAASLASLDLFTRDHGAAYEHLHRISGALMDGLRDRAQRHGLALLVQGPGPMFHAGFTPLKEVHDFRESLSYDREKFGRFVFAMLERGVRLIGRGLLYVSLAHGEEDVEQTLAVADQVLKELQ